MTLDVIKHHRWWFAISSTLVIISLISIFTKGFNFGIDYTGGTIVEVVFDQPVEVSQVRDVLNEYNLEMHKFSFPVILLVIQRAKT